MRTMSRILGVPGAVAVAILSFSIYDPALAEMMMSCASHDAAMNDQ